MVSVGVKQQGSEAFLMLCTLQFHWCSSVRCDARSCRCTEIGPRTGTEWNDSANPEALLLSLPKEWRRRDILVQKAQNDKIVYSFPKLFCMLQSKYYNTITGVCSMFVLHQFVCTGVGYPRCVPNKVYMLLSHVLWSFNSMITIPDNNNSPAIVVPAVHTSLARRVGISHKRRASSTVRTLAATYTAPVRPNAAVTRRRVNIPASRYAVGAARPAGAFADVAARPTVAKPRKDVNNDCLWER